MRNLDQPREDTSSYTLLNNSPWPNSQIKDNLEREYMRPLSNTCYQWEVDAHGNTGQLWAVGLVVKGAARSYHSTFADGENRPPFGAIVHKLYNNQEDRFSGAYIALSGIRQTQQTKIDEAFVQVIFNVNDCLEALRQHNYVFGRPS